MRENDMKSNFLRNTAIAALACLGMVSAHAANIVIDPVTGTSDYFEWSNGVGAADTTFSITLGQASSFNVQVDDRFIPGDEFALRLDGALMPWSSSGYVGSYFQGIVNGVALTAGSHVFSFDVTVAAPGYLAGAGFASFSPVSAVPEPETAALLLAGLGVIGALQRRRQSAAR
jgi:hypothetical protein